MGDHAIIEDIFDLASLFVKSDAEHSDRKQIIGRGEERTEASLLAVICLQDSTEIPCVVKDVSKSGAKLGIPRDCILPKTFMFRINGRDFVFQARLAWQREPYAGVRIVRIAKLPPTGKFPASP